MDLRLSDEQSQLQQAVRALADDLATRNPSAIPDRAPTQDWQRIVELGLPTLRSPALCGVDAAGVEVALSVEALATTLTAVPVIGQAVIVAEMLEAADATDAVEAVGTGALRLAPTLTSDLRSFAIDAPDAVAFDAAGATHALATSADGPGRRLVARELAPEPRAALDLTRELRDVTDAPASLDLDLGDTISPERWVEVEACALTALAADLVGVMQGALDDAVEYATQRHQFGVPIGSFQAIQHLAADALVQLEAARSCTLHAAWALGRLPAADALLAARTAKAYASRAGRDVVEASMQIFGGIAITWEALSHLRLRRALLDRAALGDERLHWAAIADGRLLDREAI